MATRKEILSILSGLHEDNRPTPERQLKSNFSIRDNIWTIRTIAERLYGSERINQEEYDACQRWAVMYVLTYDGPGAVQNGSSGSIIKHDKISWALHMAQEAGSIRDIRDFVGRGIHNLLVLSLYDCLSAEELARIIVGKDGKTRSTSKSVDALCIKAFQMLAEFYRLPKVNKKSRKEKGRDMLSKG